MENNLKCGRRSRLPLHKICLKQQQIVSTELSPLWNPRQSTCVEAGPRPNSTPVCASAHAFPARWVTLRGCRRAVRRQDVARAQALGAEACRKPRWRIGVFQATVGALSLSERVFCKELWGTSSSPPWPGIGMFEAITTMKVGYRLLLGYHFLHSSRDPSLLGIHFDM